jgi:ATP-dependent Clp protease ATP-binding subunit ClpA
LGPPPGYVGFEEGGKLTEAVRRRPHTLILLEHLEDAHPAVLRVFANVLTDGRLTDTQDRLCDFRHTVLVFTTRVGAEAADAGDLEAARMALRKRFPTLPLGLLSVVLYPSLTPATKAAIRDRQITLICQRVAAKYGTSVEVHATAREWLAEVGQAGCTGADFVEQQMEDLVAPAFVCALLARRSDEPFPQTVRLERRGERLVVCC